MRKILLLCFCPLVQKNCCILQEARRDEYDDGSDGEGCNDADRLEIAHGADREQQRDRQQDQQDAPHQLDQLMGLLLFAQTLAAVAGGDQRDGIEGGGSAGQKREDRQQVDQMVRLRPVIQGVDALSRCSMIFCVCSIASKKDPHVTARITCGSECYAVSGSSKGI